MFLSIKITKIALIRKKGIKYFKWPIPYLRWVPEEEFIKQLLNMVVSKKVCDSVFL